MGLREKKDTSGLPDGFLSDISVGVNNANFVVIACNGVSHVGISPGTARLVAKLLVLAADFADACKAGEQPSDRDDGE